MLTKMKLGNFKSWREMEIDLAPITLLFGTNSSGKTSILQSILLLVQTLKHDPSFDTGYVNFGGTPRDYVNLGSFQETSYKHSLSEIISINIVYRGAFRTSVFRLEIEYKNDEAYLVDAALEGEDSIEGLWDVINNEVVFSYLAPLRQYPQRAYLWSGVTPISIEPDGSNTIAALISSERGKDNIHIEVANWLNRLGLVDKFDVTALDKEKRFYEPRVSVATQNSSLVDAGFGISQVLPVITMLFFVPEGSIVLIEQPELHLHPNAQAQLADLFLEVAEKRKLQLIIESHSEHLLRRLQRRIAEPEQAFATTENIKAYFCYPTNEGSKAESVEINPYGQITNWPANFFGDISGDLEAMMDAGTQRRIEELSASE